MREELLNELMVISEEEKKYRAKPNVCSVKFNCKF